MAEQLGSSASAVLPTNDTLVKIIFGDRSRTFSMKRAAARYVATMTIALIGVDRKRAFSVATAFLTSVVLRW